MLALALALLVFCSLSASGANDPKDRASAEGIVILALLEDRSDTLQTLVVDLPSPEVALIRQSLPKLRVKLLSEDEAKPERKLPPSHSHITIKLVKIDSTHATILGGTPFVSLSGSVDRFVLKKTKGKWRIVHRDRNYEIAQAHLTKRWSEPLTGAQIYSP